MRACSRAALVLLMLAAPGCGSDASGGPATQPTPGGEAPLRVLMLTATAGFRHDSIATARDVLAAMAASSGEFTVAATEELSAIDRAALAATDVLVFALTSGELSFTSDQKGAILSFVSEGGGFMGVHSATDTLYGWPEYGDLIGAYFREHPWTREASVIVEDAAHPSTIGLGDRFSIEEEFYAFRENPRARVHVLLRLDAASVGAAGDYPLAWAHSYGSGRVYYNALGHFADTWRDPWFQTQVVAAIRWTGRR
jgi:type 1 glutamine amidotransferase